MKALLALLGFQIANKANGNDTSAMIVFTVVAAVSIVVIAAFLTNAIRGKLAKKRAETKPPEG
jgi:heme/copper-type cytochrome/quinol oxidase subunit 2